MDRVILHCDMNSFYASVELLDHPELRGAPVAVSGEEQLRHGIILAKNEAAKACGVKTAETIWKARQKCPELVLLPAHHEKYAFYSKQVNEIYNRYTDLVEPFSIDESWLDLTGSLHLFGGEAKAVADELRRVVRLELGLTLSVGVSFNKIFAKLGSDYKKPDATTVISRENFRALVWPLPVSDLLFAGRVAAGKLSAHGIDTIGQLARTPRETLVTLLGKNGGQLYDSANGLEHSPVIPAAQLPPPKSVGNGLTFRRDLNGASDIRAGVAILADRVAMRLRRCGRKGSTLQVTIRDPRFRDVSRQKRLEPPTYLFRDLFQSSLDLIASCWDFRAPIRALTITATGLVPEEDAAEQLDLFSPNAADRQDKLETLEKTMDSLRDKYGKSMIRFAGTAAPEARALTHPEEPPGGQSPTP